VDDSKLCKVDFGNNISLAYCKVQEKFVKEEEIIKEKP
jgi:hypothetical protein